MTEEEAKEWLQARLDVSRETFATLERFVALLTVESERQNLIARSTLAQTWSRHIVDSAQLVDHFATEPKGPVLDMGSGAGLPGLVLAALRPERTIRLVESRKLRCAFLEVAISEMGLANTEIYCSNLKSVQPFVAGTITARAFAPLRDLIDMARPFADASTRWVLPRGAKGVKEWQELPKRHKAMFHVEQSVTDAEAVILVGEGAA